MPPEKHSLSHKSPKKEVSHKSGLARPQSFSLDFKLRLSTELTKPWQKEGFFFRKLYECAEGGAFN